MTVHFTLQGKGGVGKTLVSNLLAQHQKHQQVKLTCIDTDPVNRSFFNYKSLDVQYFNIMKNDNVDQALFDDLIENILDNTDTDFIIDNGASGFIPLTRYLIENEVVQLLGEHEVKVNVHCVVTGGESMKDTLVGLSTLLENLPLANTYVWLNEFFGPIQSGSKLFADMKIYKDHKANIEGIVLIPNKGELFSTDLQHVLSEKMTFDDALNSSDIRIMSKSRLKKLRDLVFLNLDQVLEVSSNKLVTDV